MDSIFVIVALLYVNGLVWIIQDKRTKNLYVRKEDFKKSRTDLISMAVEKGSKILGNLRKAAK